LRTVILHYHLFKNAGTSLDRILQKYFGNAWVTREFSGPGANTDLVEDWIKETPDARAYSSHTMTGRMPEVEGVCIIPVIFLRDPLARIRSAYKFEQQQDSDGMGARLAKETDFNGYVRARLDHKSDRQCRNFHVSRLANLKPGSENELERAKQMAEFFRSHGVLGFVESFDASVAELARKIEPEWPDFTWKSTRSNTSDKRAEITEDADLTALLEDANAEDMDLLKWAMHPDQTARAL